MINYQQKFILKKKNFFYVFIKKKYDRLFLVRILALIQCFIGLKSPIEGFIGFLIQFSELFGFFLGLFGLYGCLNIK